MCIDQPTEDWMWIPNNLNKWSLSIVPEDNTFITVNIHHYKYINMNRQIKLRIYLTEMLLHVTISD